ncbi:MAG TPA: class I SAM-dependent methyltransferase [Chthoniobacteraceae bacterium]|nr:class I SAM-dependent methyltransferase [Chthoniobacteraceae bacterium]
MLDKLAHAIAQPARAAIRAADTDALRIADGAGDGFKDLIVDDFAGHWLVETRGPFPDWLKDAPQPESIHWKQLGGSESPQWTCGVRQEEPFVVSENGLKYWIDFASGYSQGIFLDQRDNRLALRKMAAGKTVLNTFAYTCAFGVSAAMGGGETVNLDLSKRYLEWGKRNYALNGLSAAAPHDFIYGDTMEWLKRFRKKGRKFDIILIDPPTFSRNEKGAVFTIESGFTPLVREAAALLNAGGTLFCSTNQRSLAGADFRYLITDGLDDPQKWELRSAPMPADFSGEQYLKANWVTLRAL